MEPQQNYSEQTPPPKNHSLLKFIITIAIVAAFIFIAIKIIENINNPSHTDGNKNPLSRSAQKSDITITQSTNFSLSDTYKLTPNCDISNLQITMQFYNSSHNLVTSKIKTIGNVQQNTEYSFSFSLTEYSFSEILEIKYWNYSVTGGTVSYFK